MNKTLNMSKTTQQTNPTNETEKTFIINNKMNAIEAIALTEEVKDENDYIMSVVCNKIENIDKKELVFIEKIENILSNENFDNEAWIGYPKEYENKIYFSAKGRDLRVAQKFRDIFGGTSIAGSVKTISKKMFSKKNGGFTIVYTIEEMKKILEKIEKENNGEVA